MADDIGSVWDRFSVPERALYDDAMESIGERYGEAVADRIADDKWIGFLYHEAMWDFDIPADYRASAYDAFAKYMDETYGVEWDEVYDWEAYRVAYDQQGAA